MLLFRPIIFINSFIIAILGIVMLVPGFLDFYLGSYQNALAFFSSSILSLCISGLFYCFSFGSIKNVSVKSGFLVTSATWLIVSIFSAIPFYFSDLAISYTDSFFEAVSGITTTGSTVLSNLDRISPGILLWRAILQWLGGIGIIVMAVAILPVLDVGGMQIFRTESSDNFEKIFPKTRDLCLQITLAYFVISFIGVIFLLLAGMDFFNSIIHIMTTISTGGFSTSDSSIAQFDSPLIEAIIIVFMIIGSLPFTLIVLSYSKGLNALFDSQVKLFLLICFSVTTIITWYLVVFKGDNIFISLRYSLFNVASIISGTGYASFDYSVWGDFPSIIILLTTFIGGCAGSASCGIKVFRIGIMYRVITNYFSNVLSNSSFKPVIYNGKIVDETVIHSVFNFFFLYIITFITFSLIIMCMGVDFITAISSSCTALSNVGPGLGPIVGPAGNFANLSNEVKWVLTFAMLLGRLEFSTLLILFTKEYWTR